jgi:hypothetical protein
LRIDAAEERRGKRLRDIHPIVQMRRTATASAGLRGTRMGLERNPAEAT